MIAVAVVAAGGLYWMARETGPAAGKADVGDASLVALGGRVYADLCASCHGRELQGQPNWKTPLAAGGYPAPPHDETGHTWHHPDRTLFDITKHGGAKFAPQGFHSNMPAFDQVASDREIWAVLAFIKSRWPEDIRHRQDSLDRRGGG